MKTYFEHKGFKIKDFKDQDFAKYQIVSEKRNPTRVFNDLEEAILYCIGITKGVSDNRLMTYVDTFITMINKSA